MPSESRQAFTTKEKLFIRELTKTLPRRHRYEAVSDAFKKKYRRALSKTTYYSILRQKNLDDVDELNPHLLRARKLFVSKYPELEVALIERLEALPERVEITPNLVFEIANVIYDEQNPLLVQTSTTSSDISIGTVTSNLTTGTAWRKATFNPEAKLASSLAASESDPRLITPTTSVSIPEPISHLGPELVLETTASNPESISVSQSGSEQQTRQFTQSPSRPRIGKTWCYRFLQRHGFKYTSPA
jgi:hypothetical protein